MPTRNSKVRYARDVEFGLVHHARASRRDAPCVLHLACDTNEHYIPSNLLAAVDDMVTCVLCTALYDGYHWQSRALF